MFAITISYEYKDQAIYQSEYAQKSITQQTIYKLLRKDLKKETIEAIFNNKMLNLDMINIYYIDLDFQRIYLEEKQQYYYAVKHALYQDRKIKMVLTSNIQLKFKNKHRQDNSKQLQFVKPFNHKTYKTPIMNSQRGTIRQQIERQGGWIFKNKEQINEKQVIKQDPQIQIAQSYQFELLSSEQIKTVKTQKDDSQYSFELLHSPRQNEKYQINEIPQQKVKIEEHQKIVTGKTQNKDFIYQDYDSICCNTCCRQLNVIPLPIFSEYTCTDCLQSLKKKSNIQKSEENSIKNQCQQKNYQQANYNNWYQAFEERIKKRENKLKNKRKIKLNNEKKRGIRPG